MMKRTEIGTLNAWTTNEGIGVGIHGSSYGAFWLEYNEDIKKLTLVINQDEIKKHDIQIVTTEVW